MHVLIAIGILTNYNRNTTDHNCHNSFPANLASSQLHVHFSASNDRAFTSLLPSDHAFISSTLLHIIPSPPEKPLSSREKLGNLRLISEANSHVASAGDELDQCISN